LGDPALKLQVMPTDVRLKAPESAAPGEEVRVTGEAPARLEGVKVRLTLERRPGTDPPDAKPPPKEPPEARAKAMRENQEKANRVVLASKEVTVKGGKFEATLPLPAKAPWPKVVVRAYAATDRAEGMGVATVAVVQPKE